VGAPNPTAGPLTVFGTEARLDVDRNSVTLVGNGETEIVDVPGVDPFKAEFQDFYEAVVNGKPLRASPTDALNDLKIVAAALRSSQTGETVRLEDLPL
jgi:predicted dehydrogenase